MRFNSNELYQLASQSKVRFDMEGILQIKERPDGLFNKSERYVERWMKLHGNLLFYLKTKERRSDPVGVLVLERYTVELDPSEEMIYSFIIMFEGDNKVFHLAAYSEEERSLWIEKLHIASFECLKMQYQRLTDQLSEKLGQETNSKEVLPGSSACATPSPTLPTLDMCVACEGLRSAIDGVLPSTYVLMSICTETSSSKWKPHSHTEIVEQSANPCFMTTLSFAMNGAGLTKDTILKTTVYDVQERMTNTMVQIGQTTVRLEDVVNAAEGTLKLQLYHPKGYRAGFITLLAWESSPLSPPPAVTTSSSEKNSFVFRLQDTCFANAIVKSFRFPTADGAHLLVQEHMSECVLTFTLPRQLLRLWIAEEKANLENLKDLDALDNKWDNIRQDIMDHIMSRISSYSQHCKFLAAHRGPEFKPSMKKDAKELEFAATNLHLQRLLVTNASGSQAYYDVMTTGAFTAYSQRYKQGGLARMLSKQREHLTENMEGMSRLDQIETCLRHLLNLHNLMVVDRDVLCRNAMQVTDY